LPAPEPAVVCCFCLLEPKVLFSLIDDGAVLM
jgi:hypothetical protein